MNPVEGFKEGTDEGQEKTGKKPAHNLRVDVVIFAGLPVGVDPQSADYSTDGSDDQYQIRETEIPAVHLTGYLIEFGNARLRIRQQCEDAKKDGLGRPCKQSVFAHRFNMG